MSISSKALLFLLPRCMAVRHVAAEITTGGCLLSEKFIQRRPWASTTRTMCLQRRCQVPLVKTSQYSFCTKTGEPFEDDYPPLPAYQRGSEPEKKDVYIVQVIGFPWSCTAEDLLKFFSECRIRDGVKGIHLAVNKSGRPLGRAFIELEHEADVSKALEKHRMYLGPRYVEVYEVTNSDAEAILKENIQVPADDSVVMLRGLPFTCTEPDITQFFSGLDIVENGITIIRDHFGRNSGEAFVQFSSQEAADEALQRDREFMGSRYIEVFPSRNDDVQSRMRMRNSGSPQTGGKRRTDSQGVVQSASLHPHFVHLRGLPFQITGKDIVKFFYPLVVSKILIEFGPDGRPSGEADVYFASHQDAVAAMSRDRQHVGGRYIELFLNTVPDSNGR